MHNYLYIYNYLLFIYLYVWILSIYKMSKGLPFLDCLITVVGTKVTDRSLKIILDTLNNLTELIL